MIRSHSILSVNRKGKGQTIDRTLITRSKGKAYYSKVQKIKILHGQAALAVDILYKVNILINMSYCQYDRQDN